MNASFFNAGMTVANTAIATADRAKAGAKATKHYASKAKDAVVGNGKAAAVEAKSCGLSFWEGVKAARAMNAALRK